MSRQYNLVSKSLPTKQQERKAIYKNQYLFHIQTMDQAMEEIRK
jgi:hypothetical protein